MLILLIDDDQDTLDLISLNLSAAGHEVSAVSAGEEGLQLLRRREPDLIILDVFLPLLNGWELCQRIRTFSSVPILMISAFARTVDDMVRAVDSGADDYLAKPLDFVLLKARVRALTRRGSQGDWHSSRPAYIDARLRLDLHRQQVYVQGNFVTLSPLEWQLLELLVRNIDQTVPAIEIVEALWPGQRHEETTSLRTYIKRLRQIIESDPRHPHYILSEHGLGYRFATQTDVHNSFTIED